MNKIASLVLLLGLTLAGCGADKKETADADHAEATTEAGEHAEEEKQAGEEAADMVTLSAAEQQAEGPPLDEASVREVLKGFLGPQKQFPPQYSAIQVGGQRAYAVARAGGQLDLPARDVEIHELELLGLFPRLQDAPRTFDPQTWTPAAQGRTFTLPAPLGEFPTLLLRAQVGSGTYLRSLARDLGAALGVPAHLGGLVRTRAGRYGLRDAVALDDLAAAPVTPDLDALDFPRIEADERLARELRQGKRPAHPLRGRAAVTLGGALVAVVDGDGEQLRVVRAWA